MDADINDEIRRRYEAGETIGGIARAMGKGWVAVCKVVNPDRYAELAANDRLRSRRRHADRSGALAKPIDLATAQSTWTADNGPVWIEDRRVLKYCPGEVAKARKYGRNLNKKKGPMLESERSRNGEFVSVALYEWRRDQELADHMASIRAELTLEAKWVLGVNE